MKKQFIILGVAFIGISLWLSSCSKEQLDSSPKIIWEARLTYKNFLASIPPYLSGDKVAISMDSSFMQNIPSSPIFFFDKNTGEFIKKWDDFFEPQKERIQGGGGTEPFQNQEKLSFCSNRKTFTVDLNTGQTLFKKWEKDYNGGLAQVTGLGNILYRHLSNGLQGNDSEDYVMEYNTLTGTNRMVHQAKGKDGYDINLRYLNVFVENQQDTVLIALNNMYHLGLRQSKTFLTKYSITKQRILFEKELPNLRNDGSASPSIVHNRKVYTFFGSQIYCHDLETGAEIWFKELGGILFSSDPVIANNTLYTNDESKTLSALNLETGQTLWKTATAGTSGNLKYMNEVIYFEGGSDGLLYAVDANNGHLFYKFRCPDEARSSSLFWQNVTVDPSTKRLYATSYGTLYCLTAVR
jgi:outer membrane protein assembly factor BamB